MQSPASSTICGMPGARKSAGQYSRKCTHTFGKKWSLMTDKGIFGAAERFYAELTDRYREKLVERAVSLYDGKARRKHPDDSEIQGVQ